MAKVIKKSSWQETCKRCRALVEFEPLDIHEGRDEDDNMPYKYVKCPNCKTTIDLLPRYDDSGYY